MASQPSFSRSKRLRVQAAELCAAPQHSAFTDLAVGIGRSSMAELGAHEGDWLLLYSSESSDSAVSANRAEVPSYAFGCASVLRPCMLADAHVSLSAAMRLQLGCETGTQAV